VCLPRYENEKERFKDLNNIWLSPEPVLTAQLIPYIDLMVGSGGTACRETALCGIPTINFHFWDVQARYLYKKGFPVQIIKNTDKIVKTTRKIVKNPKKYKIDTKTALEKIESPIPTWIQYIEFCLKK
jgi:predicted glycosyltransferase